MKPEKDSESQAKMLAVSVLFDQWRSTRKKRDRIPESLWEAAVDLSTSCTTFRIAKTLKLDFKELRRRIRERSPQESSPEFVELNVERVFSASQCVVAVRSPTGFEIRIQTGAAFPPQCVQLLSCFLDRSR